MNLILIGRNQKTLDEISKSIENKFKVNTLTLVVDFAKGYEVYPKIQNFLQDKDIGILINNVGVIPEVSNLQYCQNRI